MAQTLTATVQTQLRFTQRQTNSGFSDTESPQSVTKTVNFSNGVGAAQCNAVYAAEFDIAASATATIVLSDGSIDDFLNLGVDFVRVKGICLQLLSTADDDDGTDCTSIKMSGLNGSGGFIDGTTPFIRVFNGGESLNVSPGVAGVTAGLTLAIVNEDADTAARVRLILLGGTT